MNKKEPEPYPSEVDEAIVALEKLAPEKQERKNIKLEEIAKSLGSGGP